MQSTRRASSRRPRSRTGIASSQVSPCGCGTRRTRGDLRMRWRWRTRRRRLLGGGLARLVGRMSFGSRSPSNGISGWHMSGKEVKNRNVLDASRNHRGWCDTYQGEEGRLCHSEKPTSCHEASKVLDSNSHLATLVSTKTTDTPRGRAEFSARLKKTRALTSVANPNVIIIAGRTRLGPNFLPARPRNGAVKT